MGLAELDAAAQPAANEHADDQNDRADGDHDGHNNGVNEHEGPVSLDDGPKAMPPASRMNPPTLMSQIAQVGRSWFRRFLTEERFRFFRLGFLSALATSTTSSCSGSSRFSGSRLILSSGSGWRRLGGLRSVGANGVTSTGSASGMGRTVRQFGHLALRPARLSGAFSWRPHEWHTTRIGMGIPRFFRAIRPIFGLAVHESILGKDGEFQSRWLEQFTRV
jgi:hypothetical protein